MRAVGPIYQICFVVPDLAEAIEEWTSTKRAGPFFLFEHFDFADPSYKGQAVAPDVSLALGYSGDLNIELIQQHDETPSVYRDMIETRGYGFHHFARLTSDIDRSIADMESQDSPCVFSGKFEPDTRFAYCDSRSGLGCFTEFVEFNEAVDGLLALMQDAAKDWDGSDPVRSLPF